MAISLKSTFAAVAGAALLAGCATGPYYQDYGYGYGPGYAYPYEDYGPAYYGPGYVAPSVGFGVTYVDRDDNRRHWRGDGRGEWRGDRDGDGRRDRDGRRDWVGRGGSPDVSPNATPPGVATDGYGSRDWRNDHGQRSGG